GGDDVGLVDAVGAGAGGGAQGVLGLADLVLGVRRLALDPVVEAVAQVGRSQILQQLVRALPVQLGVVVVGSVVARGLGLGRPGQGGRGGGQQDRRNAHHRYSTLKGWTMLAAAAAARISASKRGEIVTA